MYNTQGTALIRAFNEISNDVKEVVSDFIQPLLLHVNQRQHCCVLMKSCVDKQNCEYYNKCIVLVDVCDDLNLKFVLEVFICPFR